MKNILYQTTTYAKLSIFFIICFSFYFMTNVISVSPIYLTTLLGLFLFIMVPSIKKNDRVCIFVYTTHVIYGIFYLLQCVLLDGSLHEALVSFFFSLFYIYADLVMYQVKSLDEIKITLKRYFLFFLLYYLLDAFLRYKYSLTAEVPKWMEANPLLRFYLYKFGGLNGDSNTIGTFTVVFFSVLYYARKRRLIELNLVVIAFIMALLSCSRAAIVSCIAIVIFDRFWLSANIYIKMISFFFLIFVAFMSYMLFLNDTSFLTKLDIFQKTLEYSMECNFKDFLIGLGPNNSKMALGRYAHNIWSITLIEYGFIQLMLLIFMIIATYFDIGKNSLYIFVPYFLVSLSFTPIFLQFVFVGLILIKHINRLSSKKKVNYI